MERLFFEINIIVFIFLTHHHVLLNLNFLPCALITLFMILLLSKVSMAPFILLLSLSDLQGAIPPSAVPLGLRHQVPSFAVLIMKVSEVQFPLCCLSGLRVPVSPLRSALCRSSRSGSPFAVHSDLHGPVSPRLSCSGLQDPVPPSVVSLRTL